MLTDAAQVIDALVECAPSVLAQVAVERARCIGATLMGLRVLEYFGVPAEARAVVVECYSPAYVAWATRSPRDPLNPAGEPSATDAEELARSGAKVLVVGPVPEGSPAQSGDGWPGHLVIAAGETLVDLDVQQFIRPQYGIHLPDALAVPWPDYPEPLLFEVVDDRRPGPGPALSYSPLNDDRWRRSADAKRVRQDDEVYRWAIGQVIRRIRSRLQEPAEQQA